MLDLPDFVKVFQVDHNNSGTAKGAIMSQEGRPIPLFNVKLNEAKQKYSVYNQRFYAIVQVLRKWGHYLLPKEFVLYMDHQALRYLNKQCKLNQKHMKQVEFMQNYMFSVEL